MWRSGAVPAILEAFNVDLIAEISGTSRRFVCFGRKAVFSLLNAEAMGAKSELPGLTPAGRSFFY
jgi:hypothetical protein